MLRGSRANLQQPGSGQSYDVVISGAGMVGAAAARGVQMLLNQRTEEQRTTTAPSSGPQKSKTQSCRKKVLLVDSVPKQPTFDDGNAFHKLRTVSITPMSSHILHNLGVWDTLKHRHPFHRMAIRHEQQISSSSLAAAATAPLPHFVSTFVPSTATGSTSTGQRRGVAPLLEFLDLDSPMGHICCNDEIQAKLIANLVVGAEGDAAASGGAEGDVECMFNAQLAGLKAGSNMLRNGALATGDIIIGTPANAGGTSSSPFSAKLLLGCEGRAVGPPGSTVASVVASTTIERDYQQMAFVCSVELEDLHDGNVSAFQNFFNDGRIIAFLPSGPNTTNIVFSTSTFNAKQLLPGGDKSSEENLVSYLNSMLCEFAPRDIPRIRNIVKVAAAPAGSSISPSSSSSPTEPKLARGAFPLKMKVATVPYVSRAMLLGDAAHGMHPLAGQGLNVGLYDVAALIDQLRAAHDCGEDIGSELVLSRVAQRMMVQSAPILAGVEAIKLSMTAAPTVAGLGMQLINHIPFVKTKGLQYLGSGKHLYDPNSVLFC